jgi:hypothetical protein
VARGAVLAGLVAFFLLFSAQTYDQPRPRGPTPPFGGAAEPRARGCPRETLVRFSVLEAWIRELPLGGMLAEVVVRQFIGSCDEERDGGGR